MYSPNQYLWDYKNNEPVKFKSIILSFEHPDDKARFLFTSFSGKEEELIFDKGIEWATRFTAMVDYKTGKILD